MDRDVEHQGSAIPVIGTGFLSAFISSVMNNMPTIMIIDIAMDKVGYTGNEAGVSTALAYED
jgi:arsenical pump membrane protein